MRILTTSRTLQSRSRIPSVPPDDGGSSAGVLLPQDPPDFLERLSEPGICDVRDRLIASGTSPERITDIVRQILRRKVRGAWAIDAAAEALGQAFEVMPSPRIRRGQSTMHSLVFVGPTGSGKTSTLAKLSRRLTEMDRRVVCASLDAGSASELARVGGREADVDRTEIPLMAIRDASDLTERLHRSGGAEICLIDTPSASPREPQEIARLVEQLEGLGSLGPVDVLLVMPAGTSECALELALQSLAPLNPTASVLTKLDETTQPMFVLEALQRARLPVAFLCDGTDVRAHLVRPTPARFADLGLRGSYR